jgi:hypothetical protein
MQVATYKGPAGTLQLTAKDRFLAAQGILGEGDENPSDEVMRAYLWAIMRRCLIRGTVIGYGTMWQQFSQPINPAWRADGAFCRPGGLYHGKEECSSARLARREKISATPWDNIPVKIRNAVDQFAAGALPPSMTERLLPAGRNRLSNWASYKGVRERFPWGVEIAGEWFLEDRPMRAGDVEIVGVTEVVEPSNMILKVSSMGIGIVAALAWLFFYRK